MSAERISYYHALGDIEPEDVFEIRFKQRPGLSYVKALLKLLSSGLIWSEQSEALRRIVRRGRWNGSDRRIYRIQAVQECPDLWYQLENALGSSIDRLDVIDRHRPLADMSAFDQPGPVEMRVSPSGWSVVPQLLGLQAVGALALADPGPIEASANAHQWVGGARIAVIDRHTLGDPSNLRELFEARVLPYLEVLRPLAA